MTRFPRLPLIVLCLALVLCGQAQAMDMTRAPGASTGGVMYGTLQGALTAATAAGCSTSTPMEIYLGPGTYTCTTSITMPPGLTIRGAGCAATRILSTYNPGVGTTNNWVFSNGDTVHDVWLDVPIDGAQRRPVGVASNATVKFYDCLIDGDSDAICAQGTGETTYLYNCDLHSYWDCASVQNTIYAYGTRFTSVQGAAPGMASREISCIKGSHINLYNCQLTASYPGADGTYIRCINVQSPNNTIYCVGCTMSATAGIGSGTPSDIMSTNYGSTTLAYCTGSGVGGLVKSSGHNTVTDQSNAWTQYASNVVTTNTISPPSAVTMAGFQYNGAYGYPTYSFGNTLSLKVMAYKHIGGVLCYSAAATSSNYTDNGGPTNYRVPWSWTASPDPMVEGYVISRSSTDDSDTYGYFYDVGNVTSKTDNDDLWSTGAPNPYNANSATLTLSALGAGGGDPIYNLYRRCTSVDINAAGATGLQLLPAIPGRRYRVINATLAAYGAALTTASTATSLKITSDPTGTPIDIYVVSKPQLTLLGLNTMNPTTASTTVIGTSFTYQVSNKPIYLITTGGYDWPYSGLAYGVDVWVTYAIN